MFAYLSYGFNALRKSVYALSRESELHLTVASIVPKHVTVRVASASASDQVSAWLPGDIVWHSR